MASIRNSISMVDRMTPTLRSIMKSMDSTLRVMKNLDKAANNGVQSKAYKQAEKDIKRANNALIKLGNDTKRANSAARDGEKAYSRMSTAVGAVGRGMDKLGGSATAFLQSLASGVYLAQKLANAVAGVMTQSDTSRSQVARLGLYNTSNYTNEELYGQVFSTAMNTRSDLTSTSDLINKLLVSGVFAGTTAAQSAIGTAGIINKALIAGGGTKEENERALRQLTQGLASGVLQGDELRSIREQTPYFAKVLAEGLAQVDDRFKGIGIGDLKELGAQGELTSDRVIKAMWAMQDEVNSDFEKMPKTFGQAVTSLSNIWEYFLFLISGTDGPLGKINKKLWQLVDYLQSPKGMKLMEDIAVGINVVATALSAALDAAGDFVVYLQDNAPVAQAIFIGLGTVAAAAGIKAAAAWIAAVWPILLLAGVVGLIAYGFLEAGYTAEEFLGALIGGILWTVAVIWDALLLIAGIIILLVSIVVEIILAAVWLVIFIIQLAVQIIVFVLLTLWTILEAIALLIATVFMVLWAGIQLVLGWIENRVYDLFSGLVDGAYVVAKVLDAVFGTSLAKTVSGWSKGLDDIHAKVSGFLDADKTMEDVGNMWEDFADRTAYRYSAESEWNITDNMADVQGTFGDAMTSVWDFNTMAGDALVGAMWDPNAAYDSGYAFGSGAVKEIKGLNLGFPDSSVLNKFNKDGVEVNGGYLDGIKSDVDISDEDVQLLRDMAARDFLLQLQTITPVANVTFGDVRETADVGKIVEVIEELVEQQMATSLVS